MAHVAHAARMDAVVDGFPVRVHLERRAMRLVETKGAAHTTTQQALAELEGPTIPWCVQYFVQWSNELYGRSGVGPHGLVPLMYTTIHTWATLHARQVQPHEVRALLILDSIRMYPPTESDSG